MPHPSLSVVQAQSPFEHKYPGMPACKESQRILLDFSVSLLNRINPGRNCNKRHVGTPTSTNFFDKFGNQGYLHHDSATLLRIIRIWVLNMTYVTYTRSHTIKIMLNCEHWYCQGQLITKCYQSKWCDISNILLWYRGFHDESRETLSSVGCLYAQKLVGCSNTSAFPNHTKGIFCKAHSLCCINCTFADGNCPSTLPNFRAASRHLHQAKMVDKYLRGSWCYVIFSVKLDWGFTWEAETMITLHLSCTICPGPVWCDTHRKLCKTPRGV